jgi:hypothetical protein
MKKTILAIAIVDLISSCKKEDTSPCNCGVIVLIIFIKYILNINI